MKNNRMTIEELREIAEEKGFPIELEAIDIDDVKITAIGERSIMVKDILNRELAYTFDYLDYFKSHKPEPKIETLYECWGDNGQTGLYFADGHRPLFDEHKKSHFGDIYALARKTGRTLKLNMDTWEIVTE